jgi:hypothetical protein
MWRGSVHPWLLPEVPHKGEIQLYDGAGVGVKPIYVYIKKITEKVRALNFTVFENNYSLRFY